MSLLLAILVTLWPLTLAGLVVCFLLARDAARRDRERWATTMN